MAAGYNLNLMPTSPQSFMFSPLRAGIMFFDDEMYRMQWN